MKLIIGGAYQGKRAFAMEKLGIPETQIFTCEDTHIDFSNFHFWVIRQAVNNKQIEL